MVNASHSRYDAIHAGTPCAAASLASLTCPRSSLAAELRLPPPPSKREGSPQSTYALTASARHSDPEPVTLYRPNSEDNSVALLTRSNIAFGISTCAAPSCAGAERSSRRLNNNHSGLWRSPTPKAATRGPVSFTISSNTFPPLPVTFAVALNVLFSNLIRLESSERSALSPSPVKILTWGEEGGHGSIGSDKCRKRDR